MYELTIESEFAAAHRLREYDGACENLHGHNWRVEVNVGGEELDNLGMLIDFRELKRILDEVLDEFDHKYLNDVPCFREANPTTENLSRIVFEQCAAKLPQGVHMRSVAVWESSRCWARYTE